MNKHSSIIKIFRRKFQMLQKSVSAVVLSYNRCAEVLLTIEKLQALKMKLSFPLEIIVVDNASRDDTYFQLKQKHPDITTVRKEINNGIAGWNDGFKKAAGNYILVLDDDSCIEDGLEEAVNYMERNTDVGILAFQIVDSVKRAGRDLDPEKAWKDNQDIAGFIGCGALFSKALYDTIGGFADWIYMYTHEFEYAIRCLNAGYKIKFFARGTVIHRVSSINRSNKRTRILATRNEMGIVYKYFNNNRLKYLARIFLNNLKLVKSEGVMSGWHVVLGAWQFLKLRKKLHRDPVSNDVQQFYADNFWSTKPVLSSKKYI